MCAYLFIYSLEGPRALPNLIAINRMSCRQSCITVLQYLQGTNGM